MKALKYGFGVALIAGFTLMAACGGSSSDSDDSSGAGASSAGASSTTAGDGATTAGNGSSTAGDSSVGGDTTGSTAGSPGKGGAGSVAGAPSTGTAGKGGTTGTGGAGTGGASATNPKDCPASVPSGSCMPLANVAERCTYGDQSCRCRAQQGGGMNGNAGGAGAPAGDMWQCTTVPVCPTAKPTAGEACTDGNEVCQYTGNGACVCNNNSKKWQCFGGMNGNGGAGGMSAGTAGAGGGTGATPCPQMKPAADATCTGNNLCQFGKGVGCICDGTNWVCN